MYKFKFLANCAQYSKWYKIKENCKFSTNFKNIFQFYNLKDTPRIIKPKQLTPTYYKKCHKSFHTATKWVYIKVNLSI